MAQYQLTERAEEERWEGIAEQEFAAGVDAGEIADRYLLYTIIFASVLFFAGITGKFSIKLTNEITLTIGALLLLARARHSIYHANCLLVASTTDVRW